MTSANQRELQMIHVVFWLSCIVVSHRFTNPSEQMKQNLTIWSPVQSTLSVIIMHDQQSSFPCSTCAFVFQ